MLFFIIDNWHKHISFFIIDIITMDNTNITYNSGTYNNNMIT